MKKPLPIPVAVLVIASLSLAFGTLAPAVHANEVGGQALGAATVDGWVARAQDNVCGLRDPRQLSHPALVDFRGLMEETEEMKRLRRDRIDPNSPQGIQLRDAARSKVAAACEKVMAEQGYCSVWTAIRHSDGRQVPDVTGAVRQNM